MMKVLVVADDLNVAQVVSICLNMRWPQTTVSSVASGTEGILLARTQSFDVIILDSDLPDMNGFEVCREIHGFSEVPIIMLGGATIDTNVSYALETGADVYLSKPFSHIELISRIQAVIRRAQNLPLSKNEGTFSSGVLTIDFDSREVRVEREHVKLTPIEYSLLKYLTQNAGRVLTYQALLSKVWGEKYKNNRELLRSHMRNLRRKLGDNLKNPRMIVSERELGYKFVKLTRDR